MLDVDSQPNDRFQEFQNQDVVGGLGTVPLQQEDAAMGVAGPASSEEEKALPRKGTELKDQKAPTGPTSSSRSPLPHEAHAVALPTVFAVDGNSSSDSSSTKLARPPAQGPAAHRKPARRASIRSLLRSHFSAPVSGLANRSEGKPNAGTRISSLYGQEGRVDLSVAAEALRSVTSVLTQSAGASRAKRGGSFTSQSSRLKDSPPSASVHSSPLPTPVCTSPNSVHSNPLPTALCTSRNARISQNTCTSPNASAPGSSTRLPIVMTSPSPPFGSSPRAGSSTHTGSSATVLCTSGSLGGCAECEHTGARGFLCTLCASSNAGSSSSKRTTSEGQGEQLAGAETMVEVLQRSAKSAMPRHRSSPAISSMHPQAPKGGQVLARTGTGTCTHKPAQVCSWSAAGRAINEVGATQQQQQQQQSTHAPMTPRGPSPARTAKSKSDSQLKMPAAVTSSAKPVLTVAQRIYSHRP